MGKKKGRKLTDQQEQFCQEYAIDKKGRRAAIAAHYSERTADSQASQLLKNPKVRARVDELLIEQQERPKITADQVAELAKIGLANLTHAFDSEGRMLPFRDMPEDVQVALAGVESFEEYGGQGEDRTAVGMVRKLKGWNKVAALEALGRHFKLFTDVVEVRHDLTDRLAAARKRVMQADRHQRGEKKSNGKKKTKSRKRRKA